MVNGLRVARPLVSDMLRDQGLHSRNIPAPCGFEFVRPARTGHLSESIDQHVQQPGISIGRNVALGAMRRHEILNGICQLRLIGRQSENRSYTLVHLGPAVDVKMIKIRKLSRIESEIEGKKKGRDGFLIHNISE